MQSRSAPSAGAFARLFLLAVLCVTPALSCGGCGDGDKSDDTQPVPDGPYGDVLSTLCQTIDRCPDGLGYPIAYRNTSECAAILNFLFTCRLTERDVGNDTTVFGVKQITPDMDEEEARACIAWLEEAECGALRQTGENSPCANVFQSDDDEGDVNVGTAAVDEPCNDDSDCQPDLYCVSGSSDPETGVVYCQVCKPRLGAGEECQQVDRSCQEGLHCKYFENEPRKCAELDPDDTRCVEHEQCQSGFCDQNQDVLGGWGYCSSDGNEGDDCIPNTQEEAGPGCRLDLFCESGTCTPRRENGASCSEHFQCQNSNCHVEQEGGSGTCGLPDGMPCSYGEQCANQICIDETCGGPEGACTADEQCDDGEYCAGACRPPSCSCGGSGCPVGTCTPQGEGGGGACSDDSECPAGECNNGECTLGKQIGDACSASYECYPLGYCSNGACVERHDPGQACTALDSCKEPFLCVDGKCEIMNLQCSPASSGERCAFLRVCDDASYCDLLDGVTCKPRARQGESCTSSPIRGVETCAKDSYCAAGDSGETTCQARADVGEPCDGPCVDGAYCAGGVCQGDPVGRPCGYDTPCPPGLVCSDDAEVCLPPGGEGANCRETIECADEFFCENYDTCQPRRGQGQECRDTSECQKQLHCDDTSYTCVPDLGSGDPCDDRVQPCAEGLYCPSGIDQTCQPKLPPASDCNSNNQCLSGVCYSSSFCQAGPRCKIPD